MNVTVRLDQFGHAAIEGYVRGGGASVENVVDAAVRYYLGDSDSDRVAWRVPRHRGGVEGTQPYELELDEELLGELRQESRRQDVTPELLALHALMYYLADVDSGRAAARLGNAMSSRVSRRPAARN